MTEKPREYKQRIDEQRRKKRKNRDELIEYIDEYELVDEKYKAETKQEILANFEKNEKAEKSDELYVRVGEELSSIDLKYQELKDLKEKLESKRNEHENLKEELRDQDIEGADETTLDMQMQKIKTIKSKIEKVKGEVENLKKDVQNREREIKEIEEMYGRREDTDETPIDDEKKQETQKQLVEKPRKEKPKTLQEYKETVLFEKLRIGSIRGKIIELLEEGTGIDEILKEKIKGKISDVFEKYNDEISGSLRMKSAEYMEDRDAILNLDTAFRIKSINGKKCFMRGNEQYSAWFDDIYINTKEIGGKLCFEAKKDGKRCVMWGIEQQGGWFDRIRDLQEIGGKPCFRAEKNGKWCVMRGTEQLGDWLDDVGSYIEIGGKPCFKVKKDGKEGIIRGNEQLGERFEQVGKLHGIGGKPCYEIKIDGRYCIMRGNEQIGEWFVHDDDVIAKMEELKAKSKEENMEKTSREEREKVILDRYQKKLNRDELLKIISLSDAIDEETKKKLKSEILNNFYAGFGKVTSTEEFQKLDKEYRELKKAERKKAKKSEELKKNKEQYRQDVEVLDEKLLKIANSAMKLEDDSRMKIIKSKKLNKAKEEWNILESMLNKILDGIMKLHKEEIELTGIYSGKEKKYGQKRERPKIKGKVLDKDTVTKEKLEKESTLIGHRNAYMELVKDKEKYIEEFLNQIERMDFGVSEEKKKEIIEILKSSLEKDLEVFKEGDEITKLADETEKWLNENWKTVMEQMEGLSRKIQEKRKEIEELKSKGTGDSSDEIYQNKEKLFELKKQLLKIKNQYDSIKAELNEKLENYDGTVIDRTKGIKILTWEETQKWLPFIDMGINPKDLTLHGELLNKPIYSYKDSDGSCTLFRGFKKIRSGINEIIDIKNIGGDIVLKTKNSDGYYSVFRGDKECFGTFEDKKDKYEEIYDIHEVDGKPIFLALDSDGYYSIIIGYQKYTGDLRKGYYKKMNTTITEDLEKRQYINSSKGYKIIGWEK